MIAFDPQRVIAALTNPAIIVAIVIPLAFLFMVRRLDLYASGSYRAVIGCFVWGLVSFQLAFQVNNWAASFIAWTTIVTIVAPVVEELLKSGGLVYYVRRKDFTFFVDGAIYGFATGTAFAIIENFFYLQNYSAGVGLAVARGFSTSLMHGSATALVGVSLGMFKFHRGVRKLLALPVGLACAIGLHASFNGLLAQSESPNVVLAIAIGLGGVLLVAFFIYAGLREERGYLRETLGLNVGVSAGESAVIQRMADLDELLEPIEQRFGKEKRDQVERFLRLQAQLGLKRKAAEMSPEGRLREDLLAEVDTLRAEMDAIRRAVGVYCMSYVRSILPPETEPMWTRLTATISQAPEKPPATNLWANLGSRISPTEEPK